ncbi:murein L,D-transpeptidase catalytic domain family protein [Pontibacter pudoricolor]|uniref:murein L,D-transpeptidase catalytic domain family protein n=1 Tax=Pontibacter pudoricolor TaxID=2694930 RepID=UPI001EE4CE4F|nr:murein L,D-transpeptidase catalytic domain family protein [Pontibacter pudoricolor]
MDKKKQRWHAKKRKVAKRLFPLFAPLIFSPMAAPISSSAAKTKTKKTTKETVSNYKIMQFDQVAYSLYNEMGLGQTGLKYEVFSKALTGYYNMKHEGRLSGKPVLTMVDFTKSSTQKRLWVVDVEKKELLHHTYVAHGRNSGEEFAENFSNDNKSYMSSIGFYVTQNTYHGKHGLSLKLEGVDEGFNTNALERCIVIHGAEYASPKFIDQAGRLGRSLGCPALPMEEHEDIINTVVGETAMYVHAKSDDYTSHYLDHATAMAEIVNENPNNTLPPNTDVSS